MLYLYAIIDQPSGEFDLPPGLEDAAIEILPCDGLGVVAGELAGAPVRDAANAHRHMDVLTALMKHCAVLPMQFGVTFPSREGLLLTISGLRDKLTDGLARMKGQVEFVVKVTDRSPLLSKPVCNAVRGENGAAPGSEPTLHYLTTKGAQAGVRAKQSRDNENLAETIQAIFSAMATAQTWRALPLSSGRRRVSANVLLPRDQLDAFQNGVKALREAERKLDVFMTGPWPPFSFVKEEGALIAGSTKTAETAGAEDTADTAGAEETAERIAS